MDGFEEHSAKVRNEQLKLTAGFLNALGVGAIGVSALRPLIEGGYGLSLIWCGAGFIAHVVARHLLSFLEPEG